MDEPNWRTVVPRALASPAFQTHGVSYGRSECWWWAVVDPRRRPLAVWRAQGNGAASYVESALALDAAVATNGPPPGKFFVTGRQVGRLGAARELASGTLAGLAGRLRPSSSDVRYRGGPAGGALGVALAWERTFHGWQPCGRITSCSLGIDLQDDFNEEGRWHAWLARFGHCFDDYAIGDGDLPDGALEGSGGLVRLVRDFRPLRVGDDRAYTQLHEKRGVAGWALVPTAEPAVGAGVLVVVGSGVRRVSEAARRLALVGARDAVATDPSGSAMMLARRRFAVGPPGIHRQAIQRHGLYCH